MKYKLYSKAKLTYAELYNYNVNKHEIRISKKTTYSDFMFI